MKLEIDLNEKNCGKVELQFVKQKLTVNLCVTLWFLVNVVVGGGGVNGERILLLFFVFIVSVMK